MKKTLCTILLLISVQVCFGQYQEKQKWVEENKETIAQMTRAEWLELDDPVLQQYVIMAFTPQQMHTFFQEKLEEVLELDWNENEKEHILKVKKLMAENPDLYSEDRSEELIIQINDFMMEWVAYAQTELGWTQQTIGAMVAHGGKMLDKEGNIAGAACQ